MAIAGIQWQGWAAALGQRKVSEKDSEGNYLT